MADGTGESHESFEKKRKRSGHKSCAAAECNNRSDNRPDLSYPAFPLDVETRKKCEKVNFLSRVLTTNFVVQSISFPLTLQSQKGYKKGSIPSIFDWAPRKVSQREERLKVRTENIPHAKIKEAPDSVEKDRATPKLLKESPVDCKIAKCCGTLTLEETVETLKSEIEQLKEEITKLKEREYIFTFGLERFGSEL